VTPPAGPASGFGSFLGNAAATAAGVAGGAFLFQGLENLFGHQAGAFPGASLPAETVENVTVNNFGANPGDASEPDNLADDTDTLSDADLGGADDDSSWT